MNDTNSKKELDKILAGVGNKYNASCHISEVISEKEAKTAINKLFLEARKSELEEMVSTVPYTIDKKQDNFLGGMKYVKDKAFKRLAEIERELE